MIRARLLAAILFILAANVKGDPMASPLSTIALTTLTQETMTLDKVAQNKPMYLKFWASWCKPCNEQMPHFESIQQRLGDKIQVVAINVDINDSQRDIEAVITRNKLTMPMLTDTTGKLAEYFDMRGTPLHLLLNAQGEVIYTGHSLQPELDMALEAMAAGKQQKPLKLSQRSAKEIEIASGRTAVLFTSTWCDWYLEDTRPYISANCVKASRMLNALKKSHTTVEWQTVVSRLWTNDEAVADYKAKYKLTLPVVIDESNKAFIRNKINHYPTLIVFEAGRELRRITEFDDFARVSAQLEP